MKQKVEQFEQMARDMVGDGKSPNLYFVSEEGVITTVTRDFEAAYLCWSGLGRKIETCLEDRKNGVLATTTPIEEGSEQLRTYDDTSYMLR